MNLIDKYVIEVGKHLPRRQRADIEAEIRSTLLDMLEERDQASPAAEREAAVIALLKEYGEPRKVAESYVGPRYLIGPKMYPLFELVTKIVLSVLFAIALAWLALSFTQSDLIGIEFLKNVGESAMDLLGGLITVFGNLVLVFAILERTLSAKDLEDESEEWDPATLESEPDPDQVKIADQVWEIIFLIGFLVVFNSNTGLSEAWFIRENDWILFMFNFTDAFLRYLPWLNILVLLEIVLGVYLMRQQYWTVTTRAIKIVFHFTWIALSVLMLKGPALIEITGGLSELGNLISSAVLVFIIVISSIEAAQMAYRLMKSRSTPPYPVTK